MKGRGERAQGVEKISWIGNSRRIFVRSGKNCAFVAV